MNKRLSILFLMILYDISLHLADLFDWRSLHPLFPTYPILGLPYDLFWCIFWGFAGLLTFSLLLNSGEKNANNNNRN